MKDVFNSNITYLENKGFHLKPLGDTSESFSNEEYRLFLGEWNTLEIYHYPTKQRKSVCLITQLLDDDDFKFNL
jgi:hypothetical protein